LQESMQLACSCIAMHISHTSIRTQWYTSNAPLASGDLSSPGGAGLNVRLIALGTA
jgi:hypothetical protein